MNRAGYVLLHSELPSRHFPLAPDGQRYSQIDGEWYVKSGSTWTSWTPLRHLVELRLAGELVDFA